ncbi:hypothetical protein LINPERPRIM_LOCUS20191 [Linum perenne]
MLVAVLRLPSVCSFDHILDSSTRPPLNLSYNSPIDCPNRPNSWKRLLVLENASLSCAFLDGVSLTLCVPSVCELCFATSRLLRSDAMGWFRSSNLRGLTNAVGVGGTLELDSS